MYKYFLFARKPHVILTSLGVGCIFLESRFFQIAQKLCELLTK